MGIATLNKGALIEIEQRPYKLLRQVDAGLWQMEDQRSGLIRQTSTLELQRQFADNKLIFISDVDHHLDRKIAEARRKREEVALIQLEQDELNRMRELQAYVNAIEHLPGSQCQLEPAIRQVWQQLGNQGKPPHWTTVLRWRKQYLLHGRDAHTLRVRNHRKGNRGRRYLPDVLRIVENMVEQVYLTRERKTVADTLDAAIVAVERENKLRPPEMQLAVPTRRLVQATIDRIDAFDRHAARYGNLAATRKFRSVQQMNVSDRPLECAEIDHTKLDLIVVDDETGMPWGRPWITVCIDRHTRCILGIHISFTPPSFLTVARCLKHAFLPKVDLRESSPEIDNEWQAHGVMSKLVVDNGMEFHSESLESLCLALGIDLQFTPRRTPWWKGQIERFIGTMNRGIAHGNPGTTFRNIFEKEDYDPLSAAIITYGTLKMLLNKWIADVYHQKPHRSLDNVSPAVKWASSIRTEDILLPENPASLDAILGRSDQRVLTHKGIELEGLFYNSPDLTDLRRRLGDRLQVELRIDESDLGHVHVIAPDNKEIFRVPCLDPLYANGLSSWQHEVCKRYARLHLELGNNPNAWRHAKVAIAELVKTEVLRKPRKTNAKAARFVHSEDAPPKKTKAKADTSPAATNPAVPLPAFELPPAAAPIAPPKKFAPLIANRQSS